MGQSNTKYITIDVLDNISVSEAKANMFITQNSRKKYNNVEITLVNVPIDNMDDVRRAYTSSCAISHMAIRSRKMFDKKGTVRIILTL